MTEKLLTFPSPTSPDPRDGVNRSKFYFFFQNSTNTNQQRHLYRDNMRGSRKFFVGVGGGPGSLTYFAVYRGVQWFYYTFSRGGVQMPISIETHITITCDFPGGWGSGPPIPLLDPHMDNVTVWHE